MENLLNIIGLDRKESKSLAIKLNELLANYQIFYMNVRGLHWNIKGEKFFELHLKFEELYTNLLTQIDEIAERILTLGNTPYHTYKDYENTASIDEVKNITEGNEAVKVILDGYKTLMPLQRNIIKQSESMNDEGTNALIGGYVQEQEKLIWMYNTYID